MSDAYPDIFAPLPIDEFFSRSWEQNHCHITRGDAGYFSELVSTADINAVLSTRSLYFPDVQLVHHENAIAVSDYTDDQRQINPTQLTQPMHDGATLVWSQAHKQFINLANLCRAVTQTFQMRCQTNLYLSPAGNQGFRSHYDTHDVFILQIEGSKTFRFYPSDIQLPFPDDQYDPDQNPHTEVTQSVVLNAGDTLYIPRGLVHDALAHESGPSLHITLGVFPVIVRDLLQEAIQVAAEGQVALRKSLLAASSTELMERLPDLLAAALTPETLEEAQSRLADQVALDTAPIGQLMQSAGEPTQPDTRLTLQQLGIINLERSTEQLKLRALGQVVCFEEPMSSAVEWLRDNPTFQPSELPGLNEEQQLALCAHLMNCGVVRHDR